MPGERRQVVNMVPPLGRFRSRPDGNQSFDYRTARSELRDKEDARAPVADRQPSAKMLRHCIAVMSHQYASFARRQIENFGIGHSRKSGVNGRREVYGGLGAPYCPHNAEIEVGIGLKADQGRSSPAAWRACCSRSQSSGFPTARGIAPLSKSRSAASR